MGQGTRKALEKSGELVTHPEKLIHYWPQSLHCSAELKQAGQQEALLLRRAQAGLGIAEGTC